MLDLGITEFDASVGGLGGCPYAPGASGNVATEEVVHMLHDMGLDTGIDLDRLIEAARIASGSSGAPFRPEYCARVRVPRSFPPDR